MPNSFRPAQALAVMVVGRAVRVTQRGVSTFFQKPGEVEKMESPRQGFFSDAGFTVVVASKILTGRQANRAGQA